MGKITISTKYDIGDTLWYMYDNKAKPFKVDSFKISHREEEEEEASSKNSTTIEYIERATLGRKTMLESELYKTKTDLLATL